MDYDLTEEAADDIREIVRYTLRQWGLSQVERYRLTLHQCLDQLATRDTPGRPFSSRLPDVRVSRCAQHLIFYLREGRPRPLIIALLHARQDSLSHLRKRLSP